MAYKQKPKTSWIKDIINTFPVSRTVKKIKTIYKKHKTRLKK